MSTDDIQTLKKSLCSSFCAGVSINALPYGLAISTIFEDGSGDRIGFYAVEDGGGFRLEDDGDYLAHLMASGVDFEKGQRRQLLDGVLASASAYWDPETYEIKASGISKANLPSASIKFISALMRVRDIEFLTREFIRSTFKEDATAALRERFGEVAAIEENSAIDKEYGDYPADVVIRPKDGQKDTAVFFANNAVPFQEAELLHGEIERDDRLGSYSVVALIEDTDKIDVIGRRRFQRALNRGVAVPIFRGDEKASMQAIARYMRVAA